MRRITAALLLTVGSAHANTFNQAQCGNVADAYYRLAALRDHGAAPAYAIGSVTKYLNEKDRTGSHIPGKDHRKQVTLYHDYVTARRDMDKIVLYVHGKLMCAQAQSAASDEALHIYNQKLDGVTRACLKQHADAAQRKALGQCIEAGLSANAAAAAKP